MTASQILITLLCVEAALFVLLLVAAPEMLWVHYLSIMSLARVKRTDLGLTIWSQRIGGYVLIRGYFLDFLVNMVHMTVLLREWPNIPWGEFIRGLIAVRSFDQFRDWVKTSLKYEWIVTARLTRHIAQADGRRRQICLFIRTEFLDRFDTRRPDGIHQ